jgi:hypothetical protein
MPAIANAADARRLPGRRVAIMKAIKCLVCTLNTRVSRTAAIPTLPILSAMPKEYAKEAQAAADETTAPVNGASDEPLEAVVAM